jgi:hypothetical protein
MESKANRILALLQNLPKNVIFAFFTSIHFFFRKGYSLKHDELEEILMKTKLLNKL